MKKTTMTTKHTWTNVREYVTTKDPNRVWRVQSNEVGDLRCNCPGWIFRHRHGATECKHIAHFRANPNSGLDTGAWRDEFERKVRASFLTRFAGVAVSLPTVYVGDWRAFVDDLRLFAQTTPTAPTPTTTAPVLGVRRVVLDD